jgi:hypothetical protein
MRWTLVAAVMFAGAACRQTTATPVPLVVSLEVSTVVTQRGDTVSFTVQATGNNLIGVVLEYGDDNSDQYATSGALTARVSFRHAYSAPGTFTIRAIVTDAISGEKEATASIVVN